MTTAGERERQVAELVVDDLVPGQHPQGVEPGTVINPDQHSWILIGEPLLRHADVHEDGSVDGWDQIAGIAGTDSQDQFFEFDGGPGPVSGPKRCGVLQVRGRGMGIVL